ncbi:Hypothetical protein Cul131001_1813 [Corynebacterium ulcerans]|uniref:Uncharacterized protein n=1 Tax=Corynebacterium ulcerans FRC58 TaxID=1408268 RepID=A0ABM5U3G4_CORUL|nr:Hypothetical protein Cul05146_1769 [Corynebacterium ulcerans]AKN77673.1 Hypothetical protein CulFRC58_1819 [Corynebacterium ulcerans FRC58]ALD95502.1 Hypothetical protein Cul131001_1813 [Corynebacterium ulcerans]
MQPAIGQSLFCSRTNAEGQAWRGMIAWGDALKRAVLRT